eukprot:gene5566-4201_t
MPMCGIVARKLSSRPADPMDQQTVSLVPRSSDDDGPSDFRRPDVDQSLNPDTKLSLVYSYKKLG